MFADSFEEAFYQIDADRDGVIHVNDLEAYAKTRNLKESFQKVIITNKFRSIGLISTICRVPYQRVLE